jgi:hypothetical protein
MPLTLYIIGGGFKSGVEYWVGDWGQSSKALAFARATLLMRRAVFGDACEGEHLVSETNKSAPRLLSSIKRVLSIRRQTPDLRPVLVRIYHKV